MLMLTDSTNITHEDMRKLVTQKGSFSLSCADEVSQFFYFSTFYNIFYTTLKNRTNSFYLFLFTHTLIFISQWEHLENSKSKRPYKIHFETWHDMTHLHYILKIRKCHSPVMTQSLYIFTLNAITIKSFLDTVYTCRYSRSEYIT